MIIFRNLYCTISIHPQESVLHLVWLQQPDVPTLLSIYNTAIGMTIAHGVKFWIADNGRGFNFDLCMQRALAEMCAKRLHETQVRRFARVVPLDVFQELVSHKILGMLNQLVANELGFGVFSQVEDARAWLLQDDAQAVLA